MFGFSFLVWGLIVLVILILFFISYLFVKRIKNKSLKNEIGNFRRIGYLNSILGFIAIVISVVYYVSIQSDIARTDPYLRPISEMTLEPIKFLLIVLFLIGAAALVIGSYYIRFSKKR
ncbi:MAG: hypothetical protein GXO77_10250 [Calditrichaeota bacterium]|nr:hypothetical protein [Calditrichota bacterium]